MKRNSLILLSLLLLSACAAPAQAEALPAQAIQPAVIQATRTPQPSATEIPTRTPTQNATLTAIWINQTILDQQQAKLLQDQQAIELAITQSYGTQIAYDFTRTPVRETLAAIETDQAYKTKVMVNIIGTATQVVYNQQINEVMIESKEADIEAARETRLVIWIVSILVGVGVCAFLIALAREIWHQRDQDAEEVEGAPVAVTITNADPVYLSGMWSALPISERAYREVVDKLMAGYDYTIDAMTGSENPLAKGTTYNAFGDWMVRNKIAREIRGNRYYIPREAREAMHNAKFYHSPA